MIFDLEEMRLNKWGEGRKPPLLLIGIGQYVDFALVAAAIYLLATGQMVTLPVVFIVALGIEIGWELTVKKANPDWYHTDAAFNDFTDIMGRVGLPMTAIRVIAVLIALYTLIR